MLFKDLLKLIEDMNKFYIKCGDGVFEWKKFSDDIIDIVKEIKVVKVTNTYIELEDQGY